MRTSKCRKRVQFGINGRTDNNSLTTVDVSHDPMPSGKRKPAATRTSLGQLSELRILRLSGNRLKHLDVSTFPNLRTLYADNNLLAEAAPCDGQRHTRHKLLNLHLLEKLENFSARNQSGGGAGRDTGL